jgi:Undecaprenyl-phosphate glucose phosphotransferase
LHERIADRGRRIPEPNGRPGLRLDRSACAPLAVIIEICCIVIVSVAAGVAYHEVMYGTLGRLRDFVAVGLTTGALFALPLVSRGQYSLERLIGGRGPRTLFNCWSYAFLGLAFLAFLTKTSDVASRGWIVLFYAGGLLAVIGSDALLQKIASAALRSGLISPRRVMVVGTAGEIARWRREIGEGAGAATLVAAAPLPATPPAEADLQAQLAPVIALARETAAEDVVIALPLHDVAAAARIADRLAELPIAIHIGQLGSLAQYPSLRVERLGALPTLAIMAPPLSAINAIIKRVFDLVMASVALGLLTPLLALIALAIRIDGPGPVLFRQRRRGFNQEVFEIWKFRTMTVLDDGDVIVQATPDDVRVTRVGAFLRRTNLDELPQLFQVLAGSMSLVGPRPHAVAHDKHYERVIADYARRLNVKPGITGWAQIHGCRGATRTDSDMHRRVAHDLYYIDNWSFPLDLYILIMTVLSPRAYRNAY